MKHTLTTIPTNQAPDPGRLAPAPCFSREQQFRLLEVALRIKLRSEGKPEDLITLRRPDDLPAPPGTPVRQPKRSSLQARNG